MIYLASPYSHENPAVREYRYQATLAHCAMMIRQGQIVYSPIVHHHPIAKAYDLPGDFSFWQRICLAMLERADELHVLCLDGWRQSRGVTAELAFALKYSIPHVLVERDDA